ncbi:MAG: hypothetical protein ACQEWU_16700 [Bacillota bacterium]|uniref:YesK-like protein n=1 Tax=Virgibacillus salarius TaxID=447199 RepID=A0A941DTA8_9BACI|nr:MULTISPECIES: hypothetical protein [Bacillaceae]NAZ07717.1 hypothetical protein [Agaribacter marinus]MBR7794997.1 hypothetical protein [Virgibacillus salarius]MCC2251195.1 hypothetical protein [Virgibacillus sp. AGTR]MDY7045521.1 hypothetical protein [Virgibacillus sp. M23]QRZ18722.1 hypothetical protein JUJ52_02945 [Virgibacillus sp. AGTR]
MFRILLEGWLPFILTGLITASIIILLARYMNRVGLYIITTLLNFASFALFIISIFAIGPWTGMGIGLFSISFLIGVNMGIVISFFIK